MLPKFLKLTAFTDLWTPKQDQSSSPFIVNVSYIIGVSEWTTGPENPIRTRICLANGTVFDVKESVETIIRMMEGAENSNHIVITEDAKPKQDWKPE